MSVLTTLFLVVHSDLKGAHQEEAHGEGMDSYHRWALLPVPGLIPSSQGHQDLAPGDLVEEGSVGVALFVANVAVILITMSLCHPVW